MERYYAKELAYYAFSGFPQGLETGKTGNKIMVREKSGNFILGQKSGKSQGIFLFWAKSQGIFFPEWLNAKY